jgi:tetratricopeptide (TPR) repeat protein
MKFMLIRYIRVFLPLFFFLVISTIAMQTTSAQKKEKPEKKEEQEEEQKADNGEVFGQELSNENYIFGDAMQAYLLEKMMDQNFAKSLPLFQTCIKIYPKNAAAHFKIAEIYVKKDSLDKAVPYVKKAIELSPKNKFYYTLLAEIYHKQNRFTAAIEVYENLIKNIPKSENYYHNIATIYVYQERYKEAIEVYEKLEKKFGIDEDVIKRKQKVYLQMKDVNSALKEGQKLIDAYPDVVEYKEAQAEILINQKKYEQAKKLLLAVIESSPDNSYARLLLSDIYQIQGDTQSQLKEIETAFNNPDLDLEAKLRVLTGYYMVIENENKRKTAIKLAEMTLKNNPESGKLHFYYGDFLRFDNRFKEAREAYTKAVELDGNNYQAWTSLLDIDIQLQDYEALIKHSEEGLELFPNHAIFWYMNGIGHFFKKKYDNAVESLEQAKMLASENKEILTEVHKYLGEVYQATKEYTKSDNAFEEALSLSPHDVFILNNYSYYLALRKDKLNRAKELSAKLVQISPNQPAYMDTHGWVLFTMGDYKNAKTWIEKAAQLSNDGTIIEHYGDVLYKLGQVQEAIIQWQKAKTAGGTSNMIDKKIADKKLYE